MSTNPTPKTTAEIAIEAAEAIAPHLNVELETSTEVDLLHTAENLLNALSQTLPETTRETASFCTVCYNQTYTDLSGRVLHVQNGELLELEENLHDAIPAQRCSRSVAEGYRCKRCHTAVSASTEDITPTYFAFCPEHDEDLTLAEVVSDGPIYDSVLREYMAMPPELG